MGRYREMQLLVVSTLVSENRNKKEKQSHTEAQRHRGKEKENSSSVLSVPLCLCVKQSFNWVVGAAYLGSFKNSLTQKTAVDKPCGFPIYNR